MVEDTAEYHLRLLNDRGRTLDLRPISKTPVVIVGTSAERPKARIPGRLFYEKDTGTSQVDDGSAWNAFGGAPSADPIKTVNQGTVTLGDTETFTLWRATLPTGKAIKIIEAGIQPSGTAGLTIEVYNQTDAVSIYSNNVSYDDGSYGTPLASGGIGDDVEIRLNNGSAAVQDCSGWVTFVVE